MRISDNANFDAIKSVIHQWLRDHYASVTLPGHEPLSPEQLSRYYAHSEIAMIELNLLDQHPTFLRTIRRLKNYTNRLDALKFKKELFRSRVAFK